MTMVLSNGMCRCCASEGTFKDVRSKYHWMGEEEVYAVMLKDCLNITLTEECEDGGICEVCITQLRNAANFKKQVLNTEEQLKRNITQKTTKSADDELIKMEEANENVDEADGFDNFDEGHDLSDPDYTLGVKEEKEIKEELRSKRRSIKAIASTSRVTSPESTKQAKPAAKRVIIDMDQVRLEDLEVLIVQSNDQDSHQIKKPSTPRVLIRKHLTNIRQILLCSNATPIRSHSGYGYTCSWCAEQFQLPQDLKKHSLEAHTDQEKAKFALTETNMSTYFIKLDVTNLQCTLCNEGINTPEQLLEHLNDIHDREVYTDVEKRIFPFKFNTEELCCFYCTEPFKTFRALQEHMNSHYRNYICDICDAGFVNKKFCDRHKKLHAVGSFECNQCHKFYTKRQGLRAHINHIHVYKKMSYRCRHCDELFTTYTIQQRHMAEVHGVKLKFKCETCQKMFPTNEELRGHKKLYHPKEKKFQCEECGKSFVLKQYLKDHLATHSNLRPFQCEVCAKSFGSRKTLKNHLVTHYPEKVKCKYCLSVMCKTYLRRHLTKKHQDILKSLL